MHFEKSFNYLWLFLFLLYSLPAKSQNSLPLGIVIRSNLYEKILGYHNLRQTQNKTSILSVCSNGQLAEISISGAFIKSNWDPRSSEEIYLDVRYENLILDFKVFETCDSKSKAIISSILSSKVGLLSAVWNIRDLKIELELQSNSSDTSINVLSAEKLTELISVNDREKSVMDAFLELASAKLSDWIRSKLRGLVFAQSAVDVMGDVPLWQSGTLIERGAIKLQLADPKPAQKLLTFSFFPRKTDFAFLQPKGVELYFNAAFLGLDQLSQLSGLNPMHVSNSTLMDATKSKLLSSGLGDEAPITRPISNYSIYDISLLIPDELFASAFSLLYREGLLRLKTTIEIGSKTKGIIAREAHNVSSVLTINPQSAPEFQFMPDQLKLSVKDYIMDVGTEIEDRIIPSSRIDSNITIAANLKIDSNKKTLNLALKPSKLLLELTDKKNRLSPKELEFFSKITNSVWTDFLNKNSELVLFPLVFNNDGLKVKIERANVEGKSVVLDLAIDFEGGS